MRLVIIGCGTAGATAAQFARKTGRDVQVEMLTNERYPQYSKCALPFVIAGRVKGFESVVEFGEDWFSKNRIGLRLGAEAESIDPASKEVRLAGSGEALQYDRLLISTGSSPWTPPIKDVHHGQGLKKGVFFLRTMDDAKAIDAAAREAKEAAIVGAGLTGLELAEALAKRGLKVKVFEFLKEPLLSIVDEDMAREVRARVESSGIMLRCDVSVVRAAGSEKVEGAVLADRESGKEAEESADMLVLTSGNRPNVSLAKAAGCALGPTGGVVINERAETSVPGIYSAGDCAEYRDFVTGGPILSGTAPMALQEGMTAGINAAGGKASLPKGLLSTRVTRVFGLEIAAVGPTTPVIEKSGIEPITGRFKGSNLPHYIEGREEVTVKIMAAADGRILGAQVLGPGAGLRVNTIAAAMMGSLSLGELVKMETAYAPPVSPPIDPFSVAAQGALARLKRMG